MRLRTSQFWIALLALAFFLWAPSVRARAGGGGGYSGGGGGGGGGFSSGGGGGWSSGGGGGWSSGRSRSYGSGGSSGEVDFEPFDLFLILLLVAGGAMVQAYLNPESGSTVTRTIRRHNLRQHERARDQHLAQLKIRDPSFDSGAFVARAQVAFTKIQVGWSEMCLDAVRAFMSDGVHERFSLQLAMMRRANQRNLVSGLVIHDAEIVAVTCDPDFDCIHLRFSATALDFTIDFDDNRIVSGDRHTPERFTEYWTFLRKPNAQTLARPGLLEARCPSCGAPQELNDKTVCPHCEAVINSGAYDWVLSEITQGIVWDADSASEPPPGVEELRRRDPGFSMAQVEDRASAVFWRVRAAEYFCDLDYLRKVSDPSVIAAVAGFLPEGSKTRVWYAEAAVGGVELVGVRSDEDGCDRAEVLIKWSGVKLTNAKIEYDVWPGEAVAMQHLFTFKRRQGVVPSPKNGLGSCHCPSCGVPETRDNTDVCAYCGTALNDGEHGWVLENVEPYVGIRPQRRKVSTLPRSSTRQASVADLELVRCAIA